jgi:hypothetical protein
MLFKPIENSKDKKKKRQRVFTFVNRKQYGGITATKEISWYNTYSSVTKLLSSLTF